LAAALALPLLLVASPVRAEMCGFPEECASGFCVDGFCCDTACKGPCEACSAAAKGGGVDGICGPAKSGTVCVKGYCDDDLAFVSPSLCDATGKCMPPTTPPESCITNNPCKFDLCSDTGCETATKFDGTVCDEDAGLTCMDGGCGDASPSSGSGGGGGSASGSGSGGGSASGSGSGGGSGGSGGGSGGSGGGGAPGQSGEGGAGAGDPYPPIHESGCGCRAAESASFGGAAALVMAGFALLVRSRGPARRRR
jgi:hypothetical protein